MKLLQERTKLFTSGKGGQKLVLQQALDKLPEVFVKRKQ